ncbi:MAG: hypothetical protein JW828_03390 [Sedimentisphaerales bacterium]|nr:hypothetical protein [Sedimentisphaerales bacterium]
MSEHKGKPDLPGNITTYIENILRRMRYRRSARREVETELLDHFEDALHDCADREQRKKLAEEMIREFGDVKTLARLIRRGKIRCRPWWRTACVRMVQGVCLLIVTMALYVGWFFLGRPAPATDYLAKMNRLSRPSISDQDNAWPLYKKAIEYIARSDPDQAGFHYESDEPMKTVAKLAKRDISFEQLSDTERQEVLQWMEKNAPAWEYFRQGSDKSYYYREYKSGGDGKTSTPMLLSLSLSCLSPLRDIALLGIFQAQRQAHQSPRKAMETCLALARAGWHMQTRPVLIEFLTGVAIHRLAMNECIRIMAECPLSERDLMYLQGELIRMRAQGYPPVPMDYDRMAFYDTVQHVFTQGGPGGGHLVPKPFSEVAEISEPAVSILASLAHAGRDKTLEKGAEIFDHFGRVAKMSPWQRHTMQITTADDLLDSLPHYRYSLLMVLLPALDRVGEHRFRMIALDQATETIQALQLYRMQKGGYPETLQALVASGLIDSIPQDPYSDQPLRYRKTENDFVLYSIAGNYQDDGGTMNPEDQWARNENGRDYVFWPAGEAAFQTK